MRTFKLFGIFFLTSFSLFAIQWQVIGQKSNEPVYQGNFQADFKKSLGEITVSIFNQNRIEYFGNKEGMNSILGSPTGDSLLVIESGTRMRAYGWCVRVNKKLISVLPNQFYFSDQDAVMTWYFGYMQYDNNRWFEDCYPAYVKPLNTYP